MKSKLTLVGALCALSLFGSSCDTADGLPPAAIFLIEYSVDVVGTATVSEVTYTATDGTTTVVATPALPFTATASRTAGETATLTVTGAAAGVGNSITGMIADDPILGGTLVTYASQTCEDLDPCDLSMSNSF